MSDVQPLDDELWSRVAAVAIEARDARAEAMTAGLAPSWVVSQSFPTFTHFDSGLPHFSVTYVDTPANHRGWFGESSENHKVITYGEWPSWLDLLSYASENERLRSYWPDDLRMPEDMRERFFGYHVADVWLDVLSRTLHLHGEDFTRSDLLNEYLPRERGLLHESLPVAVVAPVAHTLFDEPDVFRISDGLSLLRIPDDLQLARMPEGQQHGTAVNSVVVGAATHAIAVSQLSLPNQVADPPGSDQISFYPTEKIERFFDALRVVTGLPTGYAQLFLVPVGWAKRYRAYLPPVIHGALVRRYPSDFENWGWLRKQPPVSPAQLNEVARVYRGLDTEGDPLGLAGRRFSAAALREDKTDSILDLVIGLEAVLGDTGRGGEVTHKLALRAAAVLGQLSNDGTSPAEIVRAIKKIYDYRSGVAHGDVKPRTEFITVNDERVASAELAATYLRQVISALADRPDLRSGQAIDAELIFPRLGGASAMAK